MRMLLGSHDAERTTIEQIGGRGMKIYLVIAGWDYEGFENIMVTDSHEIATKKKVELDASKRYDYVEIQEKELVTA